MPNLTNHCKRVRKMSMNIFINESSENPVNLIRQTLSVKRDDNGRPSVTFVTNKGKGSGSQSLPVSELSQVLSVLRDAIDNGINEDDEEQSIPAHEVVRRTIAIEDGIVSFRVKSGKGAKPARIPLTQMNDVLNLLESALPAIEKHAANLK